MQMFTLLKICSFVEHTKTTIKIEWEITDVGLTIKFLVTDFTIFENESKSITTAKT